MMKKLFVKIFRKRKATTRSGEWDMEDVRSWGEELRSRNKGKLFSEKK